VITRAQALRCGVTPDDLRSLLDHGTWHRLDQGIYCTGAEPTWRQWIRAGVLWAGVPCAIGGEAAAFRYGLTGTEPPVIDLWVPVASSHREARMRWRLRCDGHGRLARASGRPAYTDVADTVLDVAGFSDTDRTLSVATRALATRRTSESLLRAAIERRSRVRHRRLLTYLTSQRRGYESPLEYHNDIDVLAAHDLPRGRRQVRTGQWMRVDCLIEEYQLVLELDGRAGHEGEGRFRDMRRDNANTLLGFRTIRLGWSDVLRRPCQTAEVVAQVLRQQGWPGEIKRCPRCRRPGRVP